jgi:hypothetical protein
VNAYVTPPGSQGFAAHEDAHDVFVLQAFGAKHWEVWEMPAPALSIELRPGDCLYIPEGTAHAARTQEMVSGHLTIGVHVQTWADLVRDALDRAEQEDAFRERLPPGWHRNVESLTARTAEHLAELGRWVDKLDPAEMAGEMARRFLITRPSLLAGSLEGLLKADTINDGARVRRLPGSICELAERGERLSAYLGDRELRMPPRVLPAMRFVSDRDAFIVGDLAPFLDGPARLVLVRRLIREGLLTVEPDP